MSLYDVSFLGVNLLSTSLSKIENKKIYCGEEKLEKFNSAKFGLWLLLFVFLLGSGCSRAYYSAMEKAGVHKRDIMVSRVEKARDAQSEAQQEFKDALEQFSSVVHLKNSNLKKAYDKLAAEYEDCQRAADKVSDRIDQVDNVAQALFREWQQEIKTYQNPEFRRLSSRQLAETKEHYRKMLSSMLAAEKSMEPVLVTFRDNVLFLKHNLNAQAIGSLQGEFSTLKQGIDDLIARMNESIAESNQFIARMNK